MADDDEDEDGKEKEDDDETATAEADEERRWLLSQGDTGAAVWDIGPARDAEAISNFLIRVAEEEGRTPCAHGIHDQTFYIDATLRRRLEEEVGVVGWRFVQRQGEAVFIPCGAPHQVLNLRSCIKTAMDFVSPEHINDCLRLTEGFRKLPRGHPRQDDPLASKVVVLQRSSARVINLGKPDKVIGQDRVRVIVLQLGDVSNGTGYACGCGHDR